VSLFAVWCEDSEGAPALRAENLSAHLDHVERNMARYRIAGPLKNSAGESAGSLLVVEARDEDDARAFVAQDPYHAAGVWSDVRVLELQAAAGTWVGGAAWKRG
jgi:uncharacterized protein YciI